jgi:hypothetical protein
MMGQVKAGTGGTLTGFLPNVGSVGHTSGYVRDPAKSGVSHLTVSNLKTNFLT